MDVLFGLDGVLVISDLMESIDLRDRLLLILEKLEEIILADDQKNGQYDEGLYIHFQGVIGNEDSSREANL